MNLIELRIRIGFRVKPMRIHADLDSDPILVRLSLHKKLDFDMKNMLYVGNTNMS
jgi:hypothetical protein